MGRTIDTCSRSLNFSQVAVHSDWFSQADQNGHSCVLHSGFSNSSPAHSGVTFGVPLIQRRVRKDNPPPQVAVQGMVSFHSVQWGQITVLQTSNSVASPSQPISPIFPKRQSRRRDLVVI